MSHVQRYDAETEAEIAAGWIPADRANAYRVARKRLLARQFAEMADASERGNEAARALLLAAQSGLLGLLNRLRRRRP